jgi:hypothetical protein
MLNKESLRTEHSMLYERKECHPVSGALNLHKVLSAVHEKVPARYAMNAIYAHAQDVAAIEEFLLAILKTFIPQSLNK